MHRLLFAFVCVKSDLLGARDINAANASCVLRSSEVTRRWDDIFEPGKKKGNNVYIGKGAVTILRDVSLRVSQKVAPITP